MLMKYYIIEKKLSMSDTFMIKNSYGEDIYIVKGSMWPIIPRYHVKDSMGNIKATIRRRFSLIIPKYDVFIDGERKVTVKRKLALSDNYSVDGVDWEVVGDFTAHDYRMIDSQGNIIMYLTKKKNVWGDNYELDVTGDVNFLLSLGISLSIVVINQLLRRMRND